MKFTPPRSKPAELRMTPIIDVIFLLLIFFVCTANFMPLEKILPMNATLPGNVDADFVLPDPIDLDFVTVQIFFDGEPHWQIEGNRPSTLGEVRHILQLIRDIRSDIPVIIASADNVPMENVIDVVDICHNLELLVQFAVEME